MLLLLAARCPAGRVQALDGHSYLGEVRLTNNAVVVLDTNGVLTTVALANISLASLESASAAAENAAGSGLGLLGSYFAGTNAEGAAFVRLDDSLDFDWNNAGPTPDLPKDRFNVQWNGELEAPVSGLFNLSLAGDGVGELYFTNQLVAHFSPGPRTQPDPGTITLPLQAGRRYPLRVSYVHFSGPARLQLSWRGPNLPRGVIPRRALHPAGLDANASAGDAANHGLLAAYYSNPEFGGLPLARIDPTVDFDWSQRDPAPGRSRTNFSVRWLARLRADYTEEYTFYTLTDEGVRVWMDGRLLIDRLEQPWLAESKESIPLVAGESYEFRMETRSTSGGAIARLFWSSASVPKTNPPPAQWVPWHQAAKVAIGQDADRKLGPGVLLRNGSFLAGAVEQASQTSLRLANPLTGRPLTTVQIARILCQPLSPALAQRITPGRAGLLLSKGDFVDGEFRNLEHDQVIVSSVLFGQRTFDTRSQVLAVVLHDVATAGGHYEVHLRDHSVLQPARLELEPDGIQLAESALGPLRLAAAEILEIRRLSSNPR